VWGIGADTEGLLADCLTTLADDPAVDAVALAVDLVTEYDGDESYPKAVTRLLDHTDKPVVVLSNLSSAVDHTLAADLRARGIPVLEGTRSGLRALGHLLDHATRPTPPTAAVEEARRDRWSAAMVAGNVDPFALLADYGIPVAPTLLVHDRDGAVGATDAMGYPVVLKTAAAEVHHKLEVDGVRLRLADAGAVAAAYDDLAGRLGPQVSVQPEVPAGVEVALGLWRDPLVGPLVLVAAGGSLVELLAERSVALPPVDTERARHLVGRLRLSELLAAFRGGPVLDTDALVDAVVGFSALAHELGDQLDAVDVNPLFVGPDGVVAVDALVVPRQ
jgi:acyl-CoA synthetase (NDP forming)